MRLTNFEDQSVARKLMPDSLAGLTDLLPLLDTGEALLLGDAVLLPARMKLNPPTIKPDSATREFWKEWRRKRRTVQHSLRLLRASDGKHERLASPALEPMLQEF